MEQNIPKLFAIQFGSLVTLYVSVTTLLVLLFNIINVVFPDALTYYSTSEGARAAIRTAIATTVVFFPAYLVLMRYSNRMRLSTTQGEYTSVMRWLIYLSLLIAGLILLGDLVTLLLYFLNGEITMRFILKVIVLFVVIGAVFYYYLQDVRGHFRTRQKEVRYYAGAALGLTLLAVVIGLMHIEAPQMIRDQRLDDQMVADLQGIQYTVDNYYQVNGALPTDLSTLYAKGNAPIPPTAGKNGEPAAYEYIPKDATHYQVCATFLTDNTKLAQQQARPIGGVDWSHTTGRNCFDEVVSPRVKLDNTM